MTDTNLTPVTDVQFPEFTANLIGSTFDALISANLRQMTAHAEFLDMISEDISTFINNTKDDITGDEALAFLENVLPAPGGSEDTTLVKTGATLSEIDAERLTQALELPDVEKPDGTRLESKTVESNQEIDDNGLKDIIEAVGQRLAYSKYEMLQKMVNQGLLRIVVERGEIEANLNFSAWDYKNTANRSTDYQRDTERKRAKQSRGFLGQVFLGPKSGSTSTTKFHVSTNTATNSAASGTRTNVTGSVKLFFKTDYLPLDQEEKG